MSDDARTFECVVSADLFRRAMFAVSTEETRYYLNGVHVSPAPAGGAVLVATNGSFLVAMHDPDAYVQGEGIVQLSKVMKAALKVSGVLLEERLLIVRDGPSARKAFVVDMPSKGADDDYSPRLAARDLFDAPDQKVQAAQFGRVCIDGNFPDWRRIIPDELAPNAPIPPLDQNLLTRVADALSSKLSGPRSLQMTCSGTAPSNSPVLVTSTGDFAPAGFAIVMPIRFAGRAAAVPAWAARPSVAEAA